MQKNILVVDDEKDIVEMLQYNLEKEGYKVFTARNGKQALEQVKRHVDLILLDIMMTEMNGLDVLRELKRVEKTKSIPVLFPDGQELRSRRSHRARTRRGRLHRETDQHQETYRTCADGPAKR